MPCCNPPQMEKRTDTEYKNITIFIYQIASVGSCSGICSSAKRIFNLQVFLFWLPLAVPIVQRSLHHCKYDLSWAVQHFFCLFVFWGTFFFHITKLHFYSHIFKFKFLFLNPLKKAIGLRLICHFPLTHHLRLQNCFFYPLLVCGWRCRWGETIREE